MYDILESLLSLLSTPLAILIFGICYNIDLNNNYKIACKTYNIQFNDYVWGESINKNLTNLKTISDKKERLK